MSGSRPREAAVVCCFGLRAQLEQRDQPGWGDVAVGVLQELGHLVPVHLPIEAVADPAAMSDVRRAEATV